MAPKQAKLHIFIPANPFCLKNIHSGKKLFYKGQSPVQVDHWTFEWFQDCIKGITT